MGGCFQRIDGAPAAGDAVPYTIIRDEVQTVGTTAQTRTWATLPVGGWVEVRARLWGTQDDVDNAAHRAQGGQGARTAGAGVFVITPVSVFGGWTDGLTAPVGGIPPGWSASNAIDPVAGVGLRWLVQGAAGQTVDWVVFIEVLDLGGGAVLT